MYKKLKKIIKIFIKNEQLKMKFFDKGINQWKKNSRKIFFMYEFYD